MNHKVIRVNDLMYKGCEPHWKCIYCNDCWPFHCYTNKELENMKCKGKDNSNATVRKL